MQLSWQSLIPPILVLILAFSTKQVVPALLIGIASACLIVTKFSPLKAISIGLQTAWNQIDISNLYTFIFLLALGVIIALLFHSGGTTAYGKYLKKRLHDAKTAETASLFLSFLFLIDDFFSCITVGNVMKPITDHFKIPRAKLAFLIDAMAAPWVILMPISSWVATLTMQLDKAGITDKIEQKPLILVDSYFMFLKIIPFIFYSYIMILAIFFIVRKRISFGPMRYQEEEAQKTGNLFGGKTPIREQRSIQHAEHGSLADFILPLILLVGTIVLFVLYSGGYHLFGGERGFLEALQKTDIFYSLCVGSIVTLLISIAWFLYKKTFTLRNIYKYALEGMQPMLTAILVLFLAWMFSNLLKDHLHTGDYLASVLIDKLSISLLPILFFVASAVASTATGSSWGTIGVMVPLAVPMVVSFFSYTTPVSPDQIAIIYPVLGAIFAGAISGDHISPIATTTIMSSSSSGCYHGDHVHTQTVYAMPALVASCIAYLISGYLWTANYWFNVAVSLFVGITICLTTLQIANKRK